MSEQNITYLTDIVLVTCIVQTGGCEAIIKAGLAFGATGIVVYHARGVGARERLGLLGVCVEAEKDVISMLVPSDHTEIVANAIYTAGRFDAPGRGYLTVTPLAKAATYVPESVLNRLREQGG